MQNTVVVGYDGTEGAKAALKQTLVLAKELGAKVAVAFSSEVSPLGGERQDLASAVRELGQQALAEASEYAALAGVEVETVLVSDKPAEGLLQIANERDARMIVVGCYGERPLAGAILGATPHRLLHLSERPVLVVRVED